MTEALDAADAKAKGKMASMEKLIRMITPILFIALFVILLFVNFAYRYKTRSVKQHQDLGGEGKPPALSLNNPKADKTAEKFLR